MVLDDTIKDNLLRNLDFLKDEALSRVAMTDFSTVGKIEDAYKLLNDYINSQQQKQENGRRN